MVSNPILDPLNKEQHEAVTTIEGPVLVLAGPGSGKTRVLTHRIAYMVKACGIQPIHIMAVTFTNKAADEMKERLERLLGNQLRGLTVGTFHSICARILRKEAEHTPYKSNYTIYDTSDQVSLIKGILYDLKKDPKKYSPNSLLGSISNAKNELILPEDLPDGIDPRERLVKQVYKHYMDRLERSNAMDFDDLLMQVVILFREHPDVLFKYQHLFKFFLVDEFQDTNVAQYELMRLLSQRDRNLFVVGDPDQSIYSFRGADYRNVQRIQKDFPELKTIPLNENYRSHQLILDAAMSVIRKDPSHIKRNLVSKRTKGPLIEVHELYTDNAEGGFIIDKIKRLHEEEGYNLSDFAIMYRTNFQSRMIEDSFVQARMPYRIVGGIRFYERREIKDMMAYLRLVNNPNDAISLERIINVPPRGIGQKTYQAFAQWVRQLDGGQEEAFHELVKGTHTPFFSGKAAASLRGFAEMVIHWVSVRDSDEHGLADLFDTILKDSNYESHLGDKRREEDAARIENIYELRRVVSEYEGMSLGTMLESLALVSDLDQVDDEQDAPVLLTLHSAKGLEFPVVFLVGLEERLLPHERSLLEAYQLAEERRLFYVGITRAKERLYITHAVTRRGYFSAEYTEPSRFLDDLPADITVRHSPMQASRDAQRAYREMRWATTLESMRDYQPPDPKFYQGAIVSHSIFGRGVVISSKVLSDIEEVQVKFETVGLKRLDGEFLKLES